MVVVGSLNTTTRSSQRWKTKQLQLAISRQPGKSQAHRVGKLWERNGSGLEKRFQGSKQKVPLL
jgi:hypothetical protein